VIDVPLDGDGAQLLLTLGVSFILFHGGLKLSVSVLSRTAIGLGLLVVPGVLVTAAVTGAVAAWAFDVPLLTGLLVGAVVAPTDPAILIPLFDRLRLRPKLAETIIAESALNDPTGAVLALAVASAVLAGDASVGGPVVEFVEDVGISLALGLVFGILLALLVSTRRAGVWRESAPLAVAIVVAGSFVSIDFAGGSGYLGAFLAGFIVSNMDELGLEMHARHVEEMRSLVGALSDVVVILVFVTLGANLPWDALRDELGPALLVVAALIVAARPLTVALCLLPDRRGRWTRNELIFIAWTRETGVLPAALAGILVGMGVPDADLITVSVALALVVTVLLQATTKPWLARRLRLLEPVAEP
jgi:cell volume regulation protein A